MDHREDDCPVCAEVRDAVDDTDPTIVVHLQGDDLTGPFLRGGDYALARGCTARDLAALLEFLYPLLTTVFPAGALDLMIDEAPADGDRVLAGGDRVVLCASRVPVLRVF